MSKTKLNIDLRQTKQLAKDFKFRSIGQFASVVNNTLNDAAFSVQKQMKKSTLPRNITMRSKWIAGSIIVDKAKFSRKNISGMKSEVGGKKKWRGNTGKAFYGLRDLEYGRRNSNHSISTMYTRGNTNTRKVRKSLRLSNMGDIEKPNKYPGNGMKQKTTAMLRYNAKRNFKGGMLIRNRAGTKKGVYVFKGRLRKKTGYKPIRLIKDLSQTNTYSPRLQMLWKATRKAASRQHIQRFFLRRAQRTIRTGRK